MILPNACVAGSVPAFVGLYTGHLLFQTSTTGTERRDPENPGGPQTSTSIPGQADFTCFGADLYGTNVYAGTVEPPGAFASVLERPGIVTDAVAWGAGWQVGTPGDVKGIAGFRGSGTIVFANVQTSAQSGLVSTMVAKLYKDTPTVPVIRVGRHYPPLHSISYADGLIYGVRDPAGHVNEPLDLYCREAVADADNRFPVDITPTKIGTVPANTYAYTVVQGRAFVLVGSSVVNPALYWRSTRTEPAFPYLAPRLLFLSGATYEIGRMSAGGHWESTKQGAVTFAYTHVTRANDGLVFFYNQTDRSAKVVRFAADGTLTIVKSYPAWAWGYWTHIVHIRAGQRAPNDISPVQEKVLFYFDGSSWAYVGYFDPATGNFISQWSSGAFNVGWQHITCTHNGDVLFFKDGTYSHGRIDNGGVYYDQGGGSGLSPTFRDIVPAGHSYLWFQGFSGTGTLCEIDQASFSVIHNYSGLPGPRQAI